MGAKKKRKHDLTERQFIEWVLTKRAEEGKRPPATGQLRNMWRSYKAEKKNRNPPSGREPAAPIDDPTQRPCRSEGGGGHEWNRERYGLRCLRCGGKVTGNPVKLWNIVVLGRQPLRQEPPPANPRETLELRPAWHYAARVTARSVLASGARSTPPRPTLRNMADIDDYERAPVQHQPNVADDPKGQKSDVRGVPIEPSGKEVDDKTGLPKPEAERQRIKDQARENQRK